MTGRGVQYQPPGYLAQRPRLPAIDWTVDWYLAAHRGYWNNWDQPVEGRTWRASSLGSCARAQTLQRKGIGSSRSLDAKTLRTFAWGDEVHSFVRKMFWRLGLVVSEEPTFADASLDVTGHVDLIWTPSGWHRSAPAHWSQEWFDYLNHLREDWLDTLGGMYPDGVPGDLLGMELKSAHSLAMKRIINEGPYPHHRIQAGAYKLMAASMTEITEKDGTTWSPSEVDRWHIAYVGKDSVGMLSFEVEDAWVVDAYDVLTKLNRFWQAGSLPPCECEGWMVSYCDYNEGDTCCGRNLKGRIAKEIRNDA